MKKINFGKKLLFMILVGFIYFSILNMLGIKSIPADSTALITATFLIGGLAPLGGLILWFWVMGDYLDHHKGFKHPSLIFICLIIFNWGAALIYFFVVIYPREKKALTSC